MYIITVYLLAINLLAFLLMGYDKHQAKRQAWRQSEKSLLALAALGGSVGIYAGTRVWRHKTYKAGFRRPFFGIVLVQVVVICWVAALLQ